MSVIVKTEHPHIVQIEGVCGGSPVVVGTRIPVRAIIGYYKLGLSVEEILEGMPCLTAAQVYDALSYYHDHQEEIEREIQDNGLESIVKRQGLQKDEQGRLIPEDSAR